MVTDRAKCEIRSKQNDIIQFNDFIRILNMYRVNDCVEPSPVTHESMPSSKESGGGAGAGAGAGAGGVGGNDGAVVGK